MKTSPTQSRERVKGRSPLWRPEAKPLVAPAGAKPRISTRKQYENVTNRIARKGQGTKSLVESRGNASGRSRRSETPHQHAERAGECHQPNRAKGSRDEVPCGVQRQRLWSLPQERNPASTRGKGRGVSPTESRERVKGRSPLWSPEAKPLVAPAGAKPRINTRK